MGHFLRIFNELSFGRKASGDHRRAVHSLCCGSGVRAGNEKWLPFETPIGRSRNAASAGDGAVDETEKLREGLRQVLEQRHRQFGFYEALMVGSGTMLVALGCVLYLFGVLIESH
jgi:hypothetical protein